MNVKFIGRNNTIDDCMIVALHNACVAAKRRSSYKMVYDLSVKNGWYSPGKGFMTEHLDAAFQALKLSAKVVEWDARKIWRSARNKNKVYLFIRPSDYENYFPGHAMVAARGDVGVKIHNPYHGQKTGWRTVQEEIEKKGKKHFVIEVTKAP